MNREYDIIIYGASSLAARYIITHLMQYNVKIALSGRSSTNIQKNISSIPNASNLAILESNIDEIDTVVQKARILINCAGPYIFCGEEVVASCVRNKTHYLDITGETYFIERVIYLFSKDAEENGVYVVNCCGFDCVPADIGVEYFKEHINEEDTGILPVNQLDTTNDNVNSESKNLQIDAHNNDKNDGILNKLDDDSNSEDAATIKSTQESFKQCKNNINDTLKIESTLILQNSAINKTTYESAVHGFSKIKETAKLRKINNLNVFLKKEKIKSFFYNRNINSYCTIFQGTDASIVKRTQSILATKNLSAPCNYHAYMKVGGFFKAVLFAIFGGIFLLLAKTRIGRFLLLRYNYFFTVGMIKNRQPTESEIKKGSFKFIFTCKNGEKKHQMVILGPDPAYTTTAACISECAMLLLDIIDGKNVVKYKFNGGVLTPGTAFYGKSIIERLKNQNINFSILTDN